MTQYDILMQYLEGGYYDGARGAYELIDWYWRSGHLSEEQHNAALRFLISHGITRDASGGDDEAGPADDSSAGDGWGGADISDGQTDDGTDGGTSSPGEEGL